MNKDLIELQKNCPATCVVVLDKDYKSLENSVVMKANVSDKFLYATILGYPAFAEKLEDNIKKAYSYFVISGIDKVSYEQQNRFVGLVKDREFMGYTLPKNCIVVFTVENKENLKKISKELYHFCVVAI